eukprot:896840_1
MSFGMKMTERMSSIIIDGRIGLALLGNERITAVLISGYGVSVRSIEFEVNGESKGIMGVTHEEYEQKLYLGPSEYIMQVDINHRRQDNSYTAGIRFLTNNGRSIECGNYERGVTLNGGFKLVDCRGGVRHNGIRSLQFLWHNPDTVYVDSIFGTAHTFCVIVIYICVSLFMYFCIFLFLHLCIEILVYLCVFVVCFSC